MTPVAVALKHLLAAGVTGDALVTAIDEIASAEAPKKSNGAARTAKWRENKRVMSQNVTSVTERHGDTGSATPVAPEATEMRGNSTVSAEKQAREQGDFVASQNVTSYNINLEGSSFEKKKEGKGIRARIEYPDGFSKFWGLFPTDPGMSKIEAFKVWSHLPDEDKTAATEAIPAFKRWIAEQGDSYRVVHAVRYLSQRRFEGFKTQAERMRERKPTGVYVNYGTDAGDAWEDHYRKVLHKPAPRDNRGGWYFPSEFPPGQHEAAA